MDRFFSESNIALYQLLASSTDVAQRRTILKLLADETANMKNELRQPSSGSPYGGGICEARNKSKLADLPSQTSALGSAAVLVWPRMSYYAPAFGSEPKSAITILSSVEATAWAETVGLDPRQS